jgi:hypothetical protein
MSDFSVLEALSRVIGRKTDGSGTRTAKSRGQKQSGDQTTVCISPELIVAPEIVGRANLFKRSLVVGSIVLFNLGWARESINSFMASHDR